MSARRGMSLSIVLSVGAIVSLTGPGFPAASAAQAPSARGSYTGPGSCAAASCHGSVRPVSGSRILQTEYTTWVIQDKHAKATSVLSNNVSLRMARVLGLPKPDAAPKCLACRSLDVPDAQRGQSDTAVGASCAAWHVPASRL